MKKVKKIVPFVDNYTDAEVRRLKVIREIQRLYEQKVSKREISRLLSVNRHTVAKYITGDPEVLCRTYKSSELDGYKDYIIKEINKGVIANEVARKIIASGFSGSFSNIRQYIAMIIKQYGLSAEKRKSNTIPGTNGYKKKNEHTIITRKGIFDYLWMNGQLTTTHRENLWTQYSTLPVLEKCIRSFREIFATQNVALLYIFIERYEKSEIKELASFARGLQKDLEAVENAVSSDYSNGLIEGTNNKVKMIKRTMYGRCSKQLLESKLMLSF